MNLTPSERAAMVKDIEALAKKYERTSDMFEGHASMRDNYSALAAALKEGLTFNEVA